MVSLTTVATAIVGAGFCIALFAWMGYDIEATIAFLEGNWSTVVLAVQVMVLYILVATGHKLAGGIVLATALITILGKVMVLE